MREIKFRAWEKNSEYMIYEVENTYEDEHHGYFYHNFRAILDSKHMEIMQFTGLHDKNGKPIYEGDIVWVADDNGCTGQTDTGMGEVVFLEGLWYIDGSVQNGLYDIDRCFLIEVIGNIYENADLLKS